MKCNNCGSDRIFSCSAHCSDRFTATFKGQEYGPDYVQTPGGRFGSGDDLEFSVCLDCMFAQVQSTLKLSDPEFYDEENDES